MKNGGSRAVGWLDRAKKELMSCGSLGMAPDDPKHNEKVGLLLVTEAHLEYNAGLVISIGSQGRPSPITSHSTAEVLAEELADYRSQLLAMARPPENPTDCSQGGTMFTPLVGVPMENSLDLVIVWAMSTRPQRTTSCKWQLCRSNIKPLHRDSLLVSGFLSFRWC